MLNLGKKVLILRKKVTPVSEDEVDAAREDEREQCAFNKNASSYALKPRPSGSLIPPAPNRRSGVKIAQPNFTKPHAVISKLVNWTHQHVIKCCSSSAKMMRAVYVDVPGEPENLLLQIVPRPQPKHGEVLIKVHATALNRADILQRRGLYPPPAGESDIIGLEVAGTVDTLGPGVKARWRPGDRVIALLCGGGYAEYVAVPEELLMPVPTNLTLCQAAAIPEAWLTAFQLLVLIAQVKEGEVVLVHAGASGVGTAAVQLVRLFGAVPIVTAGSSEKLKMAENLGAAAGFNYKEDSFAQGVHDFTGGKGANVILDCIGGTNWEQNVSSLATDGRWVLYGTMGGRAVEGNLLGKLLSKRGHLLCSLLRPRCLQYKEDLVKAFSHRVLPHFSDQPASLRPVIDSTFSLEDIAEAHRHMEANRNMGKIIIKVSPQNQETQ